MKYRQQQIKEMEAKLNDLVKYGVINKYDETWIEWTSEINEAKASLSELELELWEIKDAIREIDFKEFTDAIDNLEHSEDILSSIRDLMSEEGIFAKDSPTITELGYAQLGLMSQQLLNSKKEVENYKKLIDSLNDALVRGEITQADYNEQLKEYESAQMNAVNSVKDYKDSILDVVKNGIEKQTEAMDELIQKRKEDMSLQKEYYDFQKEMNDKSKEINSIRAQIAALDGDDSLETEQKRKKLQSQLKQMQDEYDQTLKDREFDTVQDAYDKLSEKINENKEDSLYELEADLETQNKAIAEILESVQGNYTVVYDELNKLSEEYGYKMSESLTRPWESATKSMLHYINVVGEKLAGMTKIEAITKPLKNFKPLSTDSPLYVLLNRMNNASIQKGIGSSIILDKISAGIIKTELPEFKIEQPNVASGDINLTVGYTIDRIDKNVLPDLETILEKSTEHTINVLRKYNRR